jgi:hypothetical protein
MAKRAAFRIFSTTGILGYSFPAASFEAGRARKPRLIPVDAGSTDPDPYDRFFQQSLPPGEGGR